MAYEFVEESLDSLNMDWKTLQIESSSNLIFSTPEWISAWWQSFGKEYTQYTGTIRDGGKISGIVPLMIKGDTAYLIGSDNVCDYLDFIILKDKEKTFFETLLKKLMINKINKIDLFPLKEDSTVMTTLIKISNKFGLSIVVSKIDVSPYINLPETWDGYLMILNRKQRHELGRKIRRLNEIGDTNYRVIDTADKKYFDIFFDLFRESRDAKAAFLTDEMEYFFRSVFSAMAALNYFRLNILESNSKPIAATVCFDYNNEMLLYNSGFDKTYSWLSAGLISKALAIKESINQRKIRFDFLKGNEEYKYHLGASDAPIYRCVINLK